MNEKLKKLRISSCGMTLVEVIVSMALLGIIAALVLMVFTTSFLLAKHSGDNTNVTGTASTQMNKSIIEPSGTNITAVVKFKGHASNSVDVPGQFITEQASSEKNEATMKSFVPD